MDAAPSVVHCKGEPKVCDAFDLSSSVDCEKHVGCVAERSCYRDYLFSCYSLTTPGQCAEVGCSWTGQCIGGGGCIVESTPSSCAARSGCRWDEYCDPLSHPSELYCGRFDSETSCDDNVACAWSYETCSGNPTPCESMSDEPSCTAHRDCTWQP